MNKSVPETKLTMSLAEIRSGVYSFSSPAPVAMRELGKLHIKTSAGIEWLEKAADCKWLIEMIILAQAKPKVHMANGQVWKVTREGVGALVVASDSGGGKLSRRRINYTEFPLNEITLILDNGVLMLLNEYQ